MSVIIGGGSGFIGRHLQRLLVQNGLKVKIVSRQPGHNRITWTDLTRNGLPDDCTAVVNLAGKNLLDLKSRWNESFKADVRSSRLDTTKQLVTAIMNANKPPEVFVSMSAVAHYPPSPTKEYDEDSPGGNYDFLSTLTVDWEKAAKLPKSSGVRHVIVRSGVVLGRDGGMIKQIYVPFFLGTGGRIGSGSQWFPWIHIEDIGGIITHAIINDNVSGILNGVAPQSGTNLDFTKALGDAMWRPTLIPVPGFMMNLVLGKERAKLILEGQKVKPKRTLESGYKYIFPDLASACQDCAHLVYNDEIK